MGKKANKVLTGLLQDMEVIEQRVTNWTTLIESEKPYLTLQLKFKVMGDRLRKILVCMEANDLSALANRLEREYENLIKMAEYYDGLFKNPMSKDIKPGQLETAPQELEAASILFLTLVEEIKTQISPILQADQITTKGASKTGKRKKSFGLTKRQKQAYDLLDDGFTAQQAAIQMGCTVQNVYKLRKDADRKVKAGYASRSVNFRKMQALPTDSRGQETV